MVTKVAQFAEQKGDAPALVDERGATTWAQANERINRLVSALRARGLGTGSTVALLSGNAREMQEVFCACAHASWVAVPINWHFAAEEVEYVLGNSDADVLIADARFADLAAESSQGSPSLRVCFGGDAPEGFVAYEDLLEEGSADEPDDQGEGAVMFYTSGTTGRPKGVRRVAGLGAPVEAISPRTQGFSAMMGVPPGGVTLVCGPMYHSAQWAFSSFPFDGGSALILRHKFDPAETLELIDAHQVTNVHLVPTQFVRLLRLPEEARSGFDGSSLVQVLHGAAPCPPEVKRAMIDWWGPRITEYYGGTEGAVISVISSPEWLERPTSVGKPLPVVQVQVLDDEGQPVGPGESGQLYLKNLMSPDFEYHKDQDKTASVYGEPGVFTMGDIGFLDDDGYLHLTDRKIDMIISGGVNIYPAEIEQTLGDHPAVADVAVFGVPNEEFGEEVKAVVVKADPAADEVSLADDLVAYCRERLAGYKAPRSIDFETELPRQATGKLLKRLLRDRYWDGAERQI